MEAILEKLSAAGIHLLPVEIDNHVLFERNGFAALVQSREGSLGPVGTAGLLTEHGLAPLVWRNGEAYFVGKGGELNASGDEVIQLRQFQNDLQAAIEPAE